MAAPTAIPIDARRVAWNRLWAVLLAIPPTEAAASAPPPPEPKGTPAGVEPAGGRGR